MQCCCALQDEVKTSDKPQGGTVFPLLYYSLGADAIDKELRQFATGLNAAVERSRKDMGDALADSCIRLLQRLLHELPEQERSQRAVSTGVYRVAACRCLARSGPWMR